MDVLSNLGSYFTQFDIPLNVSVISKLAKWPNLQSLGHDSMLSDLTKNFHGVKDAKVQLSTYSLSNVKELAIPFAKVQGLILLNAEVGKLLASNPVLGMVGPAVSAIGSLGAVFSVPVSGLSSGVKSIAKLVT